MSKANMRVLSKEEIDLVHDSSLRILAEVGVKIESPSVVELMRKAGAGIDKKTQTVFLKEKMVSQALKSAPKTIKLCSRRGVDFTVPGSRM